MAQKEGKTLYLPLWVTEILTTEAERYGGPGVIAAASIIHFARLSDAGKKAVLKEYHNREVELAYRAQAAAGPLRSEPERSIQRRAAAKLG